MRFLSSLPGCKSRTTHPSCLANKWERIEAVNSSCLIDLVDSLKATHDVVGVPENTLSVFPWWKHILAQVQHGDILMMRKLCE